MAREDHRSIVLTGASGGIGAALAPALAAPGRHLALIGRDAARLEAVAASARARGATVVTAEIDVRDADAMAAFLGQVDAAHPIDLVVANAGVTAGLGPGRTPEARAASRRLLEVNYGGVLNTVEPLLAAMQARGHGRIVLMSSLAGLRALPDMPSYSATKMAVRGYGGALRGWLKPFGVGVTLVFPGFVTSPMSARHGGAKPFEMSAERAAGIIARGVASGRSILAFPVPLVVGIWLLNLLIPVLSDPFMKAHAAEITPDAESS